MKQKNICLQCFLCSFFNRIYSDMWCLTLSHTICLPVYLWWCHGFHFLSHRILYQVTYTIIYLSQCYNSMLDKNWLYSENNFFLILFISYKHSLSRNVKMHFVYLYNKLHRRYFRSNGFVNYPLSCPYKHLQQHHNKLSKGGRINCNRNLDASLHFICFW